jgi:hypothetical protein
MKEPVGCETIACYANPPIRKPVPEAVRRIVEKAISQARENAKQQTDPQQR